MKSPSPYGKGNLLMYLNYWGEILWKRYTPGLMKVMKPLSRSRFARFASAGTDSLSTSCEFLIIVILPLLYVIYSRLPSPLSAFFYQSLFPFSRL